VQIFPLGKGGRGVFQKTKFCLKGSIVHFWMR